jgi:hypothetical protein
MAPHFVPTGQYDWHFHRLGGLDQVDLARGSDLANLDQLDPKLWVALSCPTRGLEFDAKTLQLIDSNGDGRIRVPEILAATRWAIARVKDPDVLIAGGPSLPLAAIDASTADGQAILESARHILHSMGKDETAGITVEDAADSVQLLNKAPFNGDGIVPVASADDPAVARLIGDIIATVGAKTDRSGVPGVDAGLLQQFYQQLAGFANWWATGEAAAAAGSDVLPLGEGTPNAEQSLQAVRAKIDDYFARCRLAAFDARATAALNGAESTFVSVAANDLSVDQEAIAALPLAHVQPGRPLPLGEGVNPAWSARIAAFREHAVAPLLGTDCQTLGEAEWRQLQGTFAAYEKWQASKVGAAVEKLGIARVRELLAADLRGRLDQLLAQDIELASRMAAIDSVEKLTRLHRDLGTLLNNFVSFRDFYDREREAIFQTGILYIDGRSCELCIPVDDAAKHAAIATLAGMYLVYCDCARPEGGVRQTIVAAITAGDADQLRVGRNGLFVDRKGRDWDANIIRIIEHPISVGQAFWSPYKRMARMIGEQIEKMAAARDKDVTNQASASIGQGAEAVAKTKPAEARAQAFDIARFAGIFAAIGLAIGAIGTVLASLMTGFLGLMWWQMPLALLGIVLLISGPSMILAWLKLRQRTIGPILDACGWAINGRVKISFKLGALLTMLGVLPPGSTRSLRDPFAPRRRGFLLALWILLALTLVLAWALF